MSRLKIVNDASGKLWGYSFHCPGCDDEHVIGLSWSFNGSVGAPTFAPSVLVRSGHYLHTPEVPGNCYCDWSQRMPGIEPSSFKCMRCHSFIRDGRIQFLGDCTHALAGQTVDLPEINGEGD